MGCEGEYGEGPRGVEDEVLSGLFGELCFFCLEYHAWRTSCAPVDSFASEFREADGVKDTAAMQNAK